MYFYLIGIDYKSAPIEVRDELYRKRKDISDYWTTQNIHGVATLITCNRLEIYGVAKSGDDVFSVIRNFGKKFPDFIAHAYLEYGKTKVFSHALKLACGLESQIKGEKQIIAQLNKWKSNIPEKTLNDLWNKAISLSQEIRIASKLDEDDSNIATLVFSDICKKLERRGSYEVAFVGTGKVAELFSKNRPPEAYLKFIANKNHIKAQVLARDSKGEALLFKDLPHILARADVLIGATSCPHYVIKHLQLKEWVRNRVRPLYIYDLAIPRDIEPQVATINGIFLQNLDDLDHAFHQGNLAKKDRIELALGLVEEALGDIYATNS